MPTKLLVILLALLGCGRAAPTTYDQRQDGDLNVKVDLDNFVVLVARPVTNVDLADVMAGLFLEAKRTQAQIPAQADAQEPEADKSKDLDDVSLDKQPPVKPEAAAAEKPQAPEEEQRIVVVVQEPDKAARSLEEVVRMSLEAKPATEGEKPRGFSGKYKFVESVEEPQSLRLIGDAIENCGPGRSRDRFGICQGDGLAMEE